MALETKIIPSQSDAAAQAPSAEAELDAAFDEAFAEETAPDPSAAQEPPANIPLDGADDAPTTVPADEAATGNSPAATADGAPEGGPQDDIWATASPELRAALEKERRDFDLRLRSAAGRHSALERELQGYRQQQTGQGQQQAPAQGQQSDGTGGNTNPLESPTIKALREEYPDLAGPLIDLISSQTATIERLSQGVGQFEQQQVTKALSEQEGILTSKHSDWLQAAQDQRFEGWLTTQPRAIREAFDRNRDAIVDGNEAALVVGLFKSEVGFGTQAAAQTPAATTAPAPPAGNDRRQRQLANGRDPGRTGPSVTSGGPSKDDFDANLEVALAQLEREQAANRR